MVYGIVVRSSEITAQSALDFAKSVLKQGHKLHRVFFYGHGVLNASNQSSSLRTQWQSLQREYQLDLVICVASAHKHKLIDPTLPSNPQQQQLPKGFTLSGLGQLADAAAHCDRLITFR